MSRAALNGPQQQIRDLVNGDAPLRDRAAAAFKLTEAHEATRNQEKCVQLAKRVLGITVEQWSEKLADAKETQAWMRPSQLVAFEADGFLIYYNVLRKGEPSLSVVEFCHECGDIWAAVKYIDSLSDLGAYEAHPYDAYVCDACKAKLAEEVAA